MNCPYCNSPGFPRNIALYQGDANFDWICVKCPNPVTYSSTEKRVTLWAIHNKCWYSVIYMEISKAYLIYKEDFELSINQTTKTDDYNYNSTFVVELPSEKTVTPENIEKKLSLWLTFG